LNPARLPIPPPGLFLNWKMVCKTNYFIGISKILYCSIFRKENHFFSTLAFAEKTGKMNQLEENRLFERINKSDQKAFEILFHNYYKILCLFASKLIHDDVAAEEIVQDFFVKLWEKREQITLKLRLKTTFFVQSKTYALNFIQHNKTKIAMLKIYFRKWISNFSDDNTYPGT
jgi:hypothetical protein